jgi:hypothetical protein
MSIQQSSEALAVWMAPSTSLDGPVHNEESLGEMRLYPPGRTDTTKSHWLLRRAEGIQQGISLARLTSCEDPCHTSCMCNSSHIHMHAHHTPSSSSSNSSRSPQAAAIGDGAKI